MALSYLRMILIYFIIIQLLEDDSWLCENGSRLLVRCPTKWLSYCCVDCVKEAIEYEIARAVAELPT